MKNQNKEEQGSYERAKKRVANIKGFYIHLAIFIVVNAIVLLTPGKLIPIGDYIFGRVDFLSWVNWKTYGTTALWAICLLFHGLSVFGTIPFLGKSWEERQIEKYIEQDRKETEKYR